MSVIIGLLFLGLVGWVVYTKVTDKPVNPFKKSTGGSGTRRNRMR